MAYIRHSFKLIPGTPINFFEKCNYCNFSVREILNMCNDIRSTYQQAIHSVPCLTEDEWIIKNIIE